MKRVSMFILASLLAMPFLYVNQAAFADSVTIPLDGAGLGPQPGQQIGPTTGTNTPPAPTPAPENPPQGGPGQIIGPGGTGIQLQRHTKDQVKFEPVGVE